MGKLSSSVAVSFRERKRRCGCLAATQQTVLLCKGEATVTFTKNIFNQHGISSPSVVLLPTTIRAETLNLIAFILLCWGPTGKHRSLYWAFALHNVRDWVVQWEILPVHAGHMKKEVIVAVKPCWLYETGSHCASPVMLITWHRSPLCQLNPAKP